MRIAKNILSAVLFGVAFFSASVLAAMEIGDYALVDATRLNVRIGPGTSYAKSGYITQNKGVKILSRTEGWVEIQTSTRDNVPAHVTKYHDAESGWNIVTGWVLEKYLREPTQIESHRAEQGSGEWLIVEKLLTDKFYSSAGEVFIKKRANTTTLVVGDQEIALDVFDAGLLAAKDDWFMLELYSGGTACPTSFKMLNTETAVPVLSKAFGTCKDGYNLVVKDQVIEVQTGGFPGEGDVAFVYDGERVEKKSMGLLDHDDVGNPYDPLSWVGKQANSYLMAPQNEGFLLEMMSWEELNGLRHATQVSGKHNAFQRDGDWVVGSGCAPSMCNMSGGVVAISIKTGKPFFAYRSWEDKKWSFLGQPPEVLPPSVRNALFRGKP